MTYKQALSKCKKVGTAHATGDALRAMYADLVALQHGGRPEKYYEGIIGGSDKVIAEKGRSLIRDRGAAYDVLMGVK